MNTIKRAASSGFSLIELMIAMLIGLIILNGVIQVVISGKRTYLDNQAISQIQENARYAIETLSREIRVAGYIGCMTTANGELDSAGVATAQPGFLVDGSNEFSALQAFNNVNAGNTGLPDQIRGSVREGTDVFIVRHTDTSSEWVLNNNLASLGGSIQVGAGVEPKAGQPMALVSHDCATASLFTAGAVADVDGGYSVTATNANGSFGVSEFQKGSRLTPLVVYAYYIGISSVVEDMPALMREVIIMDGTTVSSRSEELAVGVEDMQITLGNDAAVFSEPVGNEVSPIAVRLELTLRSHSRVNGVAEGDGEGNGADDGYIRKVATATVRVRNQG
ncbi:PilW family protein [Marinagarivorans cellulosilyticus]|uniref:Type IV pilus assembly protein PilW n=1 Tax=Marinagarivorans cellulosilyticus TaxID=2721545 RepID=A0AAN2BLZ1_9GAMM|nr:PilW family protein [Marinagarivorans cellulosilyticus]BCD99525.1 type IV pilus assembly protein PilW [Marinagarivorans cellulosilyticus]